jgi:hypothetical protein
VSATVHTILPPPLTEAVEAVLAPTGVVHVAHGTADHMAAATSAASDSGALALIGPFFSRAVADAVEATAPAGLPLLAPVATWAGVTRHDEPGCEDHPARHRGTVFRMVARDTVVAERIARRVDAEGRRALVVAGDHDYGVQLDGQLRLAGLRRADDADLVVLCGLAGEPEIERARGCSPLPILAFDGIQGESFPGQEVEIVLVYAPPHDAPLPGVPEARRAAELVLGTLDAEDPLAALRSLGRFDEHGDPIDPPVYFRRYDA